MLRASKYENTGIIWFATNSQGEQPVLFVPLLFISLVSVMVVCLYYFYSFQRAQEELAGAIFDKRILKERDEAGLKIVIEKN